MTDSTLTYTTSTDAPGNAAELAAWAAWDAADRDFRALLAVSLPADVTPADAYAHAGRVEAAAIAAAAALRARYTDEDFAEDDAWGLDPEHHPVIRFYLAGTYTEGGADAVWGAWL